MEIKDQEQIKKNMIHTEEIERKFNVDIIADPPKKKRKTK